MKVRGIIVYWQQREENNSPWWIAKGFSECRIFEDSQRLASEKRDVELGEMSEHQVKGKEGINAERPEDKKGKKFNVIVVQGLKMKTGKKKQRFWKYVFASLINWDFYPLENNGNEGP